MALERRQRESPLPGPLLRGSKIARNLLSFCVDSAGVGGRHPSVRIVLDSAGCQSYQCPSLGTCASVFPQSGVSESARSCVRFGSASHRASMASRRSISRRAWFFPAGSAKAGLRSQLAGPLHRSAAREEGSTCRQSQKSRKFADHFCWTTLRRANGCQAASEVSLV